MEDKICNSYIENLTIDELLQILFNCDDIMKVKKIVNELGEEKYLENIIKAAYIYNYSDIYMIDLKKYFVKESDFLISLISSYIAFVPTFIISGFIGFEFFNNTSVDEKGSALYCIFFAIPIIFTVTSFLVLITILVIKGATAKKKYVKLNNDMYKQQILYFIPDISYYQKFATINPYFKELCIRANILKRGQ